MLQGLTEQQKESIEKQWTLQKEQFLGRQKSMYASFIFEQTQHQTFHKLLKDKILQKNICGFEDHCGYFQSYIIYVLTCSFTFVKIAFYIGTEVTLSFLLKKFCGKCY